MIKVRPGSLRQLVLISYGLALIPFFILLWQSKAVLEELGQSSARDLRFSVQSVRLMTQLDRLAFDIERLIRQHAILKNQQLKQLSDTYLQRFDQALNQLCGLLEQPPSCGQLTIRIANLSELHQVEDTMLMDAQFADLRRNVTDLQQQLDGQLDARILANQQFVTSLQQQQLWATVLMVSISLLLIVFASKFIATPVLKLKQIIHSIANQQTALPEPSHQGPRELVTLERDMYRLAERITNLEQMRRIMLRHASHELKTPLSSIKEGCSLMSEQMLGPLNAQQVEVVELLTSSTARLNLLITQLLDYNRLLQHAHPDVRCLPVRPLVDRCLAENALAIKQQQADIQLDLQIDSLWADEELLRRILDNLLSNALAYGARSRPIDISFRKTSHHVVLEVANRGQKIPRAMQQAMFEPFRRGETTRNDSVMGAGLGLSIVADCARMMHGDVDIVEVQHADVCFRVRLPVNGART